MPALPTPVYICGAHCGIGVGAATAVTPHIDAVTGTPTVETTIVPFTGTRSWKFNTSSNTASIKRNWPSGAGVSVSRFYVRCDTRPASGTAVLVVYGGPADPAFIEISSAGVLRASINFGGTFQTGPTLPLNTWCFIDVRMTFSGTTHTLEWSVNGDQQTTVSLGGQVNSSVGNFEYGLPFTNVTATVYVTGVLLSNTSAAYPIGAGRVLGFVPGSDGTHTATGTNFLHNAAGTAITSATTDVWTLVDEIPLGGGSDFVNQQTISAAEYVEVKIAASAAPSAPRGVEVIIARHEQSTATCSASFRLYDSVGTTEDAVLTYTTQAGVVALRYSTKCYAARPAALGAWTLAAFQALRFRFGYSGDTTPNVYFDGVILEAEFAEPYPVSLLQDNSFQKFTTIGQAINRSGSY